MVERAAELGAETARADAGLDVPSLLKIAHRQEDQLAARGGEIEGLRAEIERCHRDIAALEKHARAGGGQLAERDREIVRLRSEIEGLRAEIPRYRAEIERLWAEIGARDAEIERYCSTFVPPRLVAILRPFVPARVRRFLRSRL